MRLRTLTSSPRSAASFSARPRSSGTTDPSSMAVRSDCSASSGRTSSAGGVRRPARCSAASTSTISERRESSEALTCCSRTSSGRSRASVSPIRVSTLRTWVAMSISCWLSLERSCPIAAISAFSFCCSSAALRCCSRAASSSSSRCLMASGEAAVACCVGRGGLRYRRRKRCRGEACGKQQQRKARQPTSAACRGRRCRME